MKYCGIDLSLTGTGIVLVDSTGDIIDKALFSTKPVMPIEVRIIDIAESILFFLKTYNIIDKINIEALAFGARGNVMLQLAALHYHVRIELYKRNFIYDVTSPTEVKKFVTGKGNAKKELMLLNVYKKWGISFDNNNLCDAYSLARLSLKIYGKSTLVLTEGTKLKRRKK